MNKYERTIEYGKDILRKRNITFACFKMVVACLLTPQKFDEDDWVDHYNTYAGVQNSKYFTPIEQWADEYFSKWTIDECGCELRKRKIHIDKCIEKAHELDKATLNDNNFIFTMNGLIELVKFCRQC